MPTYARWMSVERLVVLLIAQVFTYIVVGVNAAYANLTLNSTLFIEGIKVWPQSTIDTFAALNLAVAGLSNIAVAVITVVDFYRRGAFTSMIVSELCILGVLDILWLSTGAYTASKYSPVSQFCSEIQNLEGVGNVKTACATIQTSIAFSFMNFIMLTVYILMLFILVFVFSQRGVSIWKQSVRETASMTIQVPTAPVDNEYPMQANTPGTLYEPTKYEPTSITMTPTLQSVPYTIVSQNPVQSPTGGNTIQV